MHHVAIMAYMGPSLSESKEFMSDWSANPRKRLPFLEDVCQTAHNLVDMLGLCHNDIRPPNIAVMGDLYCFIDYDN